MAEEDIIYGQNRHFYGGIEPNGNIRLTAHTGYEHPAIAVSCKHSDDYTTYTPIWTNFDDTKYLGLTKGVRILRRTDRYPVDEFDGDVVVDMPVTYSGGMFYIDKEADPTGSYFYAGFPYSWKGVYNRAGLCKVAWNYPLPLISFRYDCIQDARNNAYIGRVRFVLPLDAGTAGVVIRKSTIGYPETEKDGELVGQYDQDLLTLLTSDNYGIGYYGEFYDSTITAEQPVYYSAFTYNSHGVYNRGEEYQRVQGSIYDHVVYGYDLDLSNSDPEARVTYPSSVMNYDYRAAQMNYKSGTFYYGDWPAEAGLGFMPRPCMLKNDGTVAYYLDPDDYTKKYGTTTASDVTNTSYGGNAMIEWGKLYVARWEEDGVYHFRVTDSEKCTFASESGTTKSTTFIRHAISAPNTGLFCVH